MVAKYQVWYVTNWTNTIVIDMQCSGVVLYMYVYTISLIFEEKKSFMGSCQSQGLNRPLKVRTKKGKGDKRRRNQKVERWLLMLRLNWDRL